MEKTGAVDEKPKKCYIFAQNFECICCVYNRKEFYQRLVQPKNQPNLKRMQYHACMILLS
jgi:hypothetical protein